jgi:hypothetical protein
MIPIELRFKVYTLLGESEQIIILAPNSHKQSILGSLSQTCTQTDKELKVWSSGKSTLIHSRIFGMFDPDITMFELTGDMEPDEVIWNSRGISTDFRERRLYIYNFGKEFTERTLKRENK